MSPKTKLLLLGIPVLILVIAGIAMTAFLSVNLIIQGIGSGSISDLLLGGVIGSLWLLMFWKTLKARKSAPSR